MVEITPEMTRLLVDFVLMIGSGLVGSYLTYVYAIKKTLQERVLTERVALYRPVVHCLQSVINLPHDQKKAEELENELNRLGHELLLYAPAEIYKGFWKAMSTVKKGASVTGILEFMIALRKELTGKADISVMEITELVEFRR